MPNFLPFAYFRGQFVPFAQANLSIATHALHYGTGALGGVRGFPSPDDSSQILLFRLADHCRRLSNSAKFLHYTLAPEQLQATIINFVKKNQPQAPFYIRPFIYTADLGLAPRLHNVEKDFFIYGLELGDYASPEGVTCRISSWQRQADVNFPLRGKLSASYITSALAKTEAVESGFDEAILLNTQGKVSEASGMNVFVVRNGKLITPGFEQDILEGITRDSVLAIAHNFGIPIQERPVDKSELLIADEVFLCGTAARILPVMQVDNYRLREDKPITLKLQSMLFKIMEGKDPDYFHWLEVVSLD